MISRNDFDPELASGIDWGIYNKQQGVKAPSPKSMPSQADSSNGFMGEIEGFNKKMEDYVVAPALGAVQETANMFPSALNLGKHFFERDIPDKNKLPDVPYFDNAPHTWQADVGRAGALVGTGKEPLNLIASALERDIGKVGSSIGKGIDFINPKTAEKLAEQFRGQYGSGTSAQNTQELSNRAKFSKQSTQAEALIPKEELYSQQGKSPVYEVDKSKLPEGNLGKVGEMIEPGGKFNENQMKALSKAISDFRKNGKIESFLDKSEDIFNLPEIPEKAASKIEDALFMPTKRNSAYFSDEDVTMPYSRKGQLMQRHEDYLNKPILNNYKDLRSAITTQMRKLKLRAKTDEIAAEKYDQMKLNLNNIDKDANQFMETLPENMQNLDKEFRTKYKSYAETYEKGEKDVGPSLTLRRLAAGKHSLVSDDEIVKLFSNPTEADKKAMLNMGESAARNALYAALQKVPIGNAEKMANTVLDLKRTKGFDNIITGDMETWAKNMLDYIKKSESIKRNLSGIGQVSSHIAGGAIGGMAGGPLGAAIGAALPLAWKVPKYIAEKVRK